MSHRVSPVPDPVRPQRGNVFARAIESVRSSRDFRFLWLSNLTFIGGNWSLILVLSWLVFDTTRSEFLLAVFTAVRLSPMWLGPLAGIMADRFDRVWIIRFASVWATTITLVLAVLVGVGFRPYWLLVVAGFVAGLSGSPSQPARSSLTLELVGRARLANANALNAMGFGVAGAAAPALGGVVLAAHGPSVGLLYTSCWFLLAAILMWQVTPRPAIVRVDHQPILPMITEGLRIVLKNRLTTTVLVITLAANLLIWPISNSFLAVFASDVLALGPDGLGRLMMFSGIGSFLGSFAIASLGDFRQKGRMFVLGSMVWGAGWAMFGLSQVASLSYGLIFGVGVVGAAFGVLQATLMIMTSAPEVQGRALGILELAIGSMPLGTILLGTIAAWIGVGRTTFFAGALFVLILVLHSIRVPDLLRYSGDEAETTVIG